MPYLEKNPFHCAFDRRSFIKGMGLFLMAAQSGLNAKGPINEYGPLSETHARFYQALEDKLVQCHQCYRKCIIPPDEAGHCRIRINRGGKLMTVSYGNPGAVNIDPIEKKPFSHVLPGTMTYSIATVGCNIDCKFCQNWQIAQAAPGSLRVQSLTPDQVAEHARKHQCRTIAYTYSEPTVWSEYVLDCADAGLKKGIGSLIVSNGTWSDSVLRELLKRVTAIKVDLKSIRPEYYRDVCNGELAPVLKNLETIRKSGTWLEIVTLVVPTLNDSQDEFRSLGSWIKSNLGDDVPLHFSRFHPMYKLKQLGPTPVDTLTRAWETARSEGLKYVYVGNVPNHPGEHTRCSKCGAVLIRRRGYRTVIEALKDGKCEKCGTVLPGVWAESITGQPVHQAGMLP